jgi:hypothetical protein
VFCFLGSAPGHVPRALKHSQTQQKCTPPAPRACRCARRPRW